MAGVAFITATKTLKNKKDTGVFYIGNVQDNGLVYFNDDTFYRCKNDGTELQIFSMRNQYWIKSDMLKSITILAFDVSGVVDAVGSLIGGGGVTAPSQDVEGAVQWAIAIANDDSHGYDQKLRNGPDYDCSSLVCHAFDAAGLISLAEIGYTPSTHTMVSVFTRYGFEWLPGYGNDSSKLQRGDILLNQQTHTEIYIGNGQNVGAHSNEFGGILGGQTGDQTGNEISVTNWYAKPWEGVLRYKG